VKALPNHRSAVRLAARATQVSTRIGAKTRSPELRV